MKFVDEFRNHAAGRRLAEEINRISRKDMNLMEVCGTHTVSIFRFGIKGVLPENISLLSGPGCPVCVTSNKYIDQAVFLARQHGVILATFGDMLKVPGSFSTLDQARSDGADVRIVNSTLDALGLARENPSRDVVFLGIGFETTTPTVAAAILEAAAENLANFSVLCSIKVVPGALEALLSDPMVKIDGFILPGHVSAVIGMVPYRFIAEKHRIPAVITGFEPIDILEGIIRLVKHIESGSAAIENQYSRGVRSGGNPVARELVSRVFQPAEALWRGIGVIPGTGLVIRDEFSRFDASLRFDIDVPEPIENPGCRCGEILRGIKAPDECPLFGRACTPENPVGACMVSVEGTCAAYYKYGLKGA